MLRPTPDGASDPFDLACFALIPYANRIARGRLPWGDEEYRLAPNHAGQAHPLHGLGWLVPWAVTARDDAAVTMEMRHPGDRAWPWRFSAVQTLTLSAAGLRARLTLSNDDDRAMPCSLGFHPYFAKTPGDRLVFSSDGMWLADREMLPIAHAPANAMGDWAAGAPLDRDALIDNCYTGWSGQARIARGGDVVVVEGGDTPHLHLYLPPDADFFCLEPVTAIPDAFNRSTAPVLAAGECATIEMRITAGESA